MHLNVLDYLTAKNITYSNVIQKSSLSVVSKFLRDENYLNNIQNPNKPTCDFFN